MASRVGCWINEGLEAMDVRVFDGDRKMRYFSGKIGRREGVENFSGGGGCC